MGKSFNKKKKRKEKRKQIAIERQRNQELLNDNYNKKLDKILKQEEILLKQWKEREEKYQQELKNEQNLLNKIKSIEEDMIINTNIKEEKHKKQEEEYEKLKYGKGRTSLYDNLCITDTIINSLLNNRDNCGYYLRTGVCFYGANCKRNHPCSFKSKILLFHNILKPVFDKNISLKEGNIENTQKYNELIDNYNPILNDILSEIKKYGQIIDYKIACNDVDYLKGNMYIEFNDIDTSEKVRNVFSGRYYSSILLYPQYMPLLKINSGICKDFLKGKCRLYKSCRFIHLLTNKLHSGKNIKSKRDYPSSKKPKY